MKIHGRYPFQIGSIITFLLIMLLAGCGGGGDGSSDAAPAATVVPALKANAGNIIGIRVGQVAYLDGASSTSATSSALTYNWSFTHKPQTSKTAVLSDANIVNPEFTPDVVGSYMLQLIVSADGNTSQRSIALVEASVTGNVTGDVRVHTSFSSQCSDCHDGRFLDVNVTPGIIIPKTGNHVGTSNNCQACHTTFGFNLIRFVDHNEVSGNCSSCHNGTTAVGKSSTHLITNSECSDCHNTTSFLTLDINGKYDHTGITSGCDSCHNGKVAIGTNHTASTASLPNSMGDCALCHNTTSFADAKPDHTILLTSAIDASIRCDSCHSVAGTATAPITDHPVTTVDCYECHSIQQFNMGGVFSHRLDASIVSCETCHTEPNSINAKGTASFPIDLPPGSHGATNGNDCGVCHGTSIVRSFTNTIIDHSAADIVLQSCDSCHDGAGTALHKTTNHIPTFTDCKACHTPGSFLTGTFDHSAPNMDVLTCSGCHNGTNTAGKSLNHIPTDVGVECDACHAADTPLAPNTFKGASFHVANIPTSCISCHDGVIQTGKTTTHVPTTTDCVSCHTTTPLTFIGATFNHTAEGVTTCSSCHNGVIAIDKTAKVNHIPAQQECSQCHVDTTVTGGFITSKFITDVHPSLATGCEGCHSTKYFSATATPLVVKALTHIPTIQDCNSCHTNVNFADKTKFTHAGIAGNCESCHSGSYFVSANAKGKATPIPLTPHPVTTADCGACHAIGKGFLDGVFDHTGIVDNCASCHDGSGASTTKLSVPTGTTHVATTQDCSICHIPGTFKTIVFNHAQIVDNCTSCHDGSGASTTKLSVLPPKVHLTTVEDCSVCHNTTAFAGARFDHTGIIDNCASCHDGLIALGKNGTHVPTGDDCSVCHTTAGMIPATFTHTGIVNNCVSCHDGNLATGKTLTHVATTSDCGLCHTVPSLKIIANGATNGWIPAGFDHSGISNNTRCDSCHGVTSTGKDQKTNPLHWDTSLDCRVCHTTSTFLGGTWTHEPTSQGTCDTCHTPFNGTNGGARDKSSAINHINTSSQCDQCHTTQAWAPTSFTHDLTMLTQDGYPGDHLRNPPCSSCHGNSVGPIPTYPSNSYVKILQNGEANADPYCAACHANNFDRKGDHNGGENGTVEQNKDCSEAGCHRVNDDGF